MCGFFSRIEDEGCVCAFLTSPAATTLATDPQDISLYFPRPLLVRAARCKLHTGCPEGVSFITLRSHKSRNIVCCRHPDPVPNPWRSPPPPRPFPSPPSPHKPFTKRLSRQPLCPSAIFHIVPVRPVAIFQSITHSCVHVSGVHGRGRHQIHGLEMGA